MEPPQLHSEQNRPQGSKGRGRDNSLAVFWVNNPGGRRWKPGWGWEQSSANLSDAADPLNGEPARLELNGLWQGSEYGVESQVSGLNSWRDKAAFCGEGHMGTPSLAWEMCRCHVDLPGSAASLPSLRSLCIPIRPHSFLYSECSREFTPHFFQKYLP